MSLLRLPDSERSFSPFASKALSFFAFRFLCLFRLEMIVVCTSVVVGSSNHFADFTIGTIVVYLVFDDGFFFFVARTGTGERVVVSFAVAAHGIGNAVSMRRSTTVGAGLFSFATHFGVTVMSAVVAQHRFRVVGTRCHL